MKYSEHYGDLWSAAQSSQNWKVITINIYVKKNGDLVMGRGIAKQATQRYPGIAYALGRKITEVISFTEPENQLYVNLKNNLIAMPVKRFWGDEADLKLIDKNLEKLATLGNHIITHDLGKLIYLPRPGCGNGKKDWDTEVKPLVDQHLNGNFVVCHKRSPWHPYNTPI